MNQTPQRSSNPNLRTRSPAIKAGGIINAAQGDGHNNNNKPAFGAYNNNSNNNNNSKRPRGRKLKQVQYFLFGGFTLLALTLNQYAGTASSHSNSNHQTNAALHSSSSSSFNSNNNNNNNNNIIDEVLYFDEVAMKNVRATYDGARSWLKWATETILEVTIADKLDQFQAIPLLATVDRRPLIARKQMTLDTDNLHDNGNLLGCAVSATTFISKIENVYLKSRDSFPVQCDICFQFSNREDMNAFLPDVGFEPISDVQESIATKCFGGTATSSARFVNWQSKDPRFEGFGYPFTVDCTLPNGIQELTCREISKMQRRIDTHDEIQAIYLQTKFTLDAYFGDPYVKTFHAFSRWPWPAVQSHDDDRRHIATSLPKTWNDYSSRFVPSSVRDLKLLHIEGPGYAMSEFEGRASMQSMLINKDTKGALHNRLLVNLFHLIRNTPQSTHMMAIVDGQVRTTYRAMATILGYKVADMFHSYADIFTELPFLNEQGIIPKYTMKGKGDKSTTSSSSTSSINSDMTLADLLHLRGIKLHIVPVTSPSLAFERSVCGGQYTFAAYLAARFAADYHVMMYVDGDTAMIEGSDKTLTETLYNRFFSQNSSKCAGHRIRLIEQFVKPEDDRTQRVLQCTEDISLDSKKWEYANENCHLKEGHIVARTDSILAMSVHHPDTDTEFVPEGVEDCITPGNKENDRYFIKADEFVQLHLRNRLRKDECVCFADATVSSS